MRLDIAKLNGIEGKSCLDFTSFLFNFLTCGKKS